MLCVITNKSFVLKNIIYKITKEYSPHSTETIDDWINYIRIEDLKKGHQLVKEGQYSDKLYYIVKGSVKAYYIKDGKILVT